MKHEKYRKAIKFFGDDDNMKECVRNSSFWMDGEWVGNDEISYENVENFVWNQNARFGSVYDGCHSLLPCKKLWQWRWKVTNLSVYQIFIGKELGYVHQWIYLAELSSEEWHCRQSVAIFMKNVVGCYVQEKKFQSSTSCSKVLLFYVIEVLLISKLLQECQCLIFPVHGNGYLMFAASILGDQSQVHDFIAHSQNHSHITHVIPPVALAT